MNNANIPRPQQQQPIPECFPPAGNGMVGSGGFAGVLVRLVPGTNVVREHLQNTNTNDNLNTKPNDKDKTKRKAKGNSKDKRKDKDKGKGKNRGRCEA